ncbi:DUF4258 domain-containing protein [Candidatus Woesearchaeota archaeon]|nr:DUF4258 domain-containing protein [Candidatus Woesearchaeota archaeon]
MTLKIQYSKHAREQMILRGVSETEVEEGIKKGSKTLQKPNKIISTFRYYEVVYRKLEDTYFVITVQPRW